MFYKQSQYSPRASAASSPTQRVIAPPRRSSARGAAAATRTTVPKMAVLLRRVVNMPPVGCAISGTVGDVELRYRGRSVISCRGPGGQQQHPGRRHGEPTPTQRQSSVLQHYDTATQLHSTCSTQHVLK